MQFYFHFDPEKKMLPTLSQKSQKNLLSQKKLQLKTLLHIIWIYHHLFTHFFQK